MLLNHEERFKELEEILVLQVEDSQEENEGAQAQEKNDEALVL